MRRNLAMCTMVVAGLLSWTMLLMGATRLAEAGSETCADMLVGKAFTCEVVGEGPAEPLCFEFVPAVSPPPWGLTITHNFRALREQPKGQVADNKKGAADNTL